MRKIESQMCAAVQSNKNWSSGNTQVITEDNISKVYLHGNHIATIDDDSMTIFDGGWQSNTTKSRLNALCDAFCIEGEGVFQKDFKWYVRKLVGQSSITGKVFNVDDFVNGYVFAWSLTNTNIMRIALTLIVVILGANLMIDILDSDMMDIIEDRQNTIERLIEES